MKVVTVLDFLTAEVCIYRYSPSVLKKKYEDNIELFIQEKGHSLSNCEYMCADELTLKVV
jgi:hypothetical protein